MDICGLAMIHTKDIKNFTTHLETMQAVLPWKSVLLFSKMSGGGWLFVDAMHISCANKAFKNQLMKEKKGS